jgi:hypothetical protein
MPTREWLQGKRTFTINQIHHCIFIGCIPDGGVLWQLKNLRKLLLTSALGLLLQNCGGGGGGGATNFVNNIVSELDGSGTIAQSYFSNISNLNSVLSQLGGVGSLQSVFTSPNSKDIENARQLNTIVGNAETLWSQSIALIEAQSPSKATIRDIQQQ